MVTYQSSEFGWEVTMELPTYSLSIGRGFVSDIGETFGTGVLTLLSMS